MRQKFVADPIGPAATGILIGEVVGLSAALAGKAPLIHTHAIADVTGLTAALDAKAPLASPALTGTPTAPTPSTVDNSTQVATTAFVQAVVAALVNSSPATLDTLNELAVALGNDPNYATTTSTLIGTKAAKSANLSDLTDLAAARSNLNVPTRTGGDASGTWGINVTGTAPAGSLTGTTLAVNVVSSSLTTVGALNSGSITSGFGSIDVGTDSITGGAISGTTGTFVAAADVIIGTENASGDGRGVIAASAAANGNAGFTWRTNGVNRWTMDTVGTSDSESVRIRKLGTGPATIATFSSTGLAVTGAVTANVYSLNYNTGYYLSDGAISNYSAANYLYINGNTGGGLILKAAGASNSYIQIPNSGATQFYNAAGFTFDKAITVGSGVSTDGNIKSFYSGAGPGITLENTNDSSGTYFVAFRKAAGATIGSVTRVTTTDAVAFNTTSDGRLKENFGDIKNSGELIDALRPYTFDRKDGSDKDRKGWFGFKAQQVYAADPVFARIGFVTPGDDDPVKVTRPWLVGGSPLDALFVAELQSLRARVAVLETRP